MDWINTTDELPKLYAPVLTDWMGTTFLTPDGWDGGLPPVQWAYVPDPHRDENQQSISEWGQHTFGVTKDPAILVGRALEEFGEICALLLDPAAGKKFTEMIDSVKARLMTHDCLLADARLERDGRFADELADVVVVLLQVAEGYGLDLLGAVDSKMVVNRARKWKTDKFGVGQHE